MPVLQSKFEVKVWRRLNSGACKSKKGLIKCVESISDHDGPINSDILVEAIKKVTEHGCAGQSDMIRRLVGKSRPNDCGPALRAAMVFVGKGDVRAAKDMESMAGYGDMPFHCCVKAMISSAEGDLDTSRKDLQKAMSLDPKYPLFYEVMHRIDPNSGWMYRRNIELLASGEDIVPCGEVDGGGKWARLYKVYREWYRGDKDEATRLMVSSKEYEDEDPHFMLASARMSVSEKDWRSAGMMYDRVMSKVPDCVYIQCEAANARLLAKDSMRALSLYHIAEESYPGSETVIRGIISASYACGMMDEAVSTVEKYLDRENVRLPAYMWCAENLYGWGMYDEASKVISRVMGTYPREPGACVLLSKMMEIRGDVGGASRMSSQSVRWNPDDVGSRIRNAEMLLSRGNVRRAYREVDKALKLRPKNLHAILIKIRIMSYEGDVEGALAMCREAMAYHPDNPEILNIMSDLRPSVYDGIRNRDGVRIHSEDRQGILDKSITLIRNEKYIEALDLCSEYRMRFGDDVIISRLRGNSEYALGKYQKASASYESAAVFSPTDPIIWYSKGMADERAGDLDSAEEAFNKAVLMDMDEPEFWISRSSVQEKKGDFNGAVESLNKAISLDPSSSYALVRKGMLFGSFGRYDEALYFLDLARVTDDTDRGILAIERDLCVSASMNEKTVEISKKMLAMDPEDSDTLGILIRSYVRNDDIVSARSIVSDAMRMFPKNISILLEVKDFMLSIGSNKEAIEVYESILSLNPDNSCVKRDLIRLYREEGMEESAEKISLDIDSEDAPSDGTSESEMDYRASMSMIKNGDTRGALRVINSILGRYPSEKKYILAKSAVLRDIGDIPGASNVLSEWIGRYGNMPEVCEADGDLRSRIADHHGAIMRYEAVMINGSVSSALYLKCGHSREMIKDFDKASDNYVAALAINPRNADASVRLAYCHLMRGDIRSVKKVLEGMDSADSSAMIIALRARVSASERNVQDVRNMHSKYLLCTNRDSQSDEVMSEALIFAGVRSDIGVIDKGMGHANNRKVVSDEIRRLSERVLRRAYVSSLPLRDPDLIRSLDIDDHVAEDVMGYLSDIPEYGNLAPGTPEFDRMEGMSLSVVLKGKLIGLDKDPVVPLQCAFVLGGARDADEAKRLVSYIYKVMKTEISCSSDIGACADIRFDTATPIESVMMETHTGIYHAKALRDRT